MNQVEAEDNEFHSAEEAIDAYRTLTDRDRANLTKVARFFEGRGNVASADELLNEAYIRIEAGRRRWRKVKTFPAFLAGVIKSLASDDMFVTDAHKVRALEGGYSVIEQDDLASVRGDSDDSTPQQRLMVEQMWSHMERHFAEDEEMQLLLMGIQDRLRGRDLEAAVGVDARRLEALRTRFNRELDKYIAARSAGERTVA